ncbi:MAG: Ldh family oxidoreductase [Planctomycetota bacterium]|nr:Ldh family oxidoreductase [Planctomycetota bacterium]MDA1137920.1 Ldh family oxidoreductase [Planctomycetota bacterium]
MPTVFAPELRSLCITLLRAWGAAADEAELVADCLVQSNLEGHDSHGVLRLPQYLERIESGIILPGADIKTVRERKAMAVLDGAWNFGQVIAVRAAEMAIAKARECSQATVTAFHCNHVGRLARFCQIAVDNDCIGIMAVNGHGGDQGTAPFGGTDRRLPTNPIGFGIPTGKDFNIILDMTTSVAAGGKMRVAQNLGKSVPEGWLLDADGKPTTDPSDYFGPPPGCSLPFGGHKGFGLSLVVDILAGALSEAGCSRPDPELSANAIFFQAIHIESFTTLEEFRQQVDRLIDHVKASPPAEGIDEILVPGEASARRVKERTENGIPIDEKTWETLESAALGKGIRI